MVLHVRSAAHFTAIHREVLASQRTMRRGRPLRLRFALLAAIVVAAALGCSHRAQRPNVLLILIHPLPAAPLGCYGYARQTSPHLDSLAREAILFRHAYAQAPWTKPSIPTLFTSLYAIQHGVYEGERRGVAGAFQSDVLALDTTTIAEAFQQA